MNDHGTALWWGYDNMVTRVYFWSFVHDHVWSSGYTVRQDPGGLIDVKIYCMHEHSFIESLSS